MEELPDHVLAHPPQCLAAFRATPGEIADEPGWAASATFRLSSPSGEDAARVLGHRLDRLVPAYAGPLFVSPLALLWPGEAEPTPLFDSARHGYHGELGASAKVRGTGPPDTFACPSCGGESFSVAVRFDYGEACLDLAEDEPEVAVENYFQNIRVDGCCLRCGATSRVTEMDL